MNIASATSQATAPVPQKPAEGTPAKVDDKGQARNTEPAKSQPLAKDTVHVSTTAQKMVQEATETAAQTAVEASKGDSQAKRLLAREEAEKANGQGKPAPEIPADKGSNVDVTA